MITRDLANEFVRSLGYEPNVVVSVALDYRGATVTHVDPEAKGLESSTTHHEFEGEPS